MIITWDENIGMSIAVSLNFLRSTIAIVVRECKLPYGTIRADTTLSQNVIDASMRDITSVINLVVRDSNRHLVSDNRPFCEAAIF